MPHPAARALPPLVPPPIRGHSKHENLMRDLDFSEIKIGWDLSNTHVVAAAVVVVVVVECCSCIGCARGKCKHISSIASCNSSTIVLAQGLDKFAGTHAPGVAAESRQCPKEARTRL